MTEPTRKLIFLVSTHGKTEDEIVDDWTRAYEAWRASQGHDSPDGATTTE